MLHRSAIEFVATNRNKYDIFAKMLKTCEEGVSKTNLMYDARVNYPVLQAFLNELISTGLIEVNKTEKRKIYLSSENGRKYLRHYNSMKELISKENNRTLNRILTKTVRT